MDYKEKYEKALKIAKGIYHGNPSSNTAKVVCEQIFPELKESEDERIRKDIICYITDHKNWFPKEETKNSWIAWLEKQGEQKPYIWHREDEQNLNAVLSYINDEPLRRWLKDVIHLKYDKPADKVEPKFKVGDWIIKNDDSSINIDYSCCKITKVENGNYTIESIYGYKGYNTFETFEKDYHLWTIQDAKDGDVLANRYGSVFINAGFENDDKITLNNYCYVGVNGKFYVEEHTTGSWLYVSDVKPATQEQRDLLFQKMKEAGYVWDAEKKELKKIEQKTAENIDNLHNYLYEEQKPAWSEEDERMFNTVIIKGDLKLLEIDWLKSLKERCTWKPSDEQMNTLEQWLKDNRYNGDARYCYPIFDSLYQYLKKLMEE